MRDDADLVAALRRGDEAAFAELVDAWGPSMLRLARTHVPSHSIAEEVVQETWVAVLNGLDRFEGRSSLKTWVFSILLNVARSRGQRERRSVPFAALRERWDMHRDEDVVPPERFQGRDGERPGWWAAPPSRWGDPHEQLASKEAQAVMWAAIEQLPARQREALVLRDVLGLDAGEASTAMGISEGNQRVLLHRGRAKVRNALERHLAAA
ncbi:MAG TPA: sigma-70 family RNA polymerase sigma factor [Solirubrobacter sp.]|nr:sigma-70 family RNA polymerase sigma factor [Solirubrobacter sp.]